MFKILFQLILLLLVLGCSAKNDENTLKVQLTAEPVSLDFSTAEDGLSMRIFGAMMSGLTKVNSQNKLVAEIAEKIETLERGRKFKVTLKPWRWSDGKELTADDFVYGIKRTLEPATISKLSDLLFFIKNALPYKKGKLKDFAQVGVRAIDSNTLLFELEDRFMFFPHILSLSVAYPQREDIVTKYGKNWPEHMEVTGPYKLKQWQHDKKIVLEKNSFYSGFKENSPVQIDMLILQDESTAMNLFESNKLDLLTRFPALEYPRLKMMSQLVEAPFLATYYIAFNQKNPLWRDKNARLAVAYSIQRDEIVKSIGGKEFVARSWIHRAMPEANDNIGIPFDPVKAKKHWNLVKPSLKADSNAFVLGFDSGGRNQTILEKIQSDLKQNLGVSFTLKNRDWKTYVSELASNTPPIFRFGFLSVFVDPFAHLFLFESGNPNNYTGWTHPKYDSLLKRIAELNPETDRQKRQQAINEIQKLLLEDEVVVVPLYHYLQSIAFSKRVSGLAVNGMGVIDFANVELTH